ncbi:HAD family phosphatase [candidate division KSB1 bacterium]|nr:HAD family phosphatase [candidate division KSB1 bacterium]
MDFSIKKNNYGFAVIFDMDGVIVDSNPVHKKALKQFCKSHGFDLTDSELRNKIYGRANKDWLPELFQNNLPAEEYEKLAKEKEALFRKLYSPVIKPLTGLINFLEELVLNNIPRAVATSAPPENVEFALEKTGTRKYFEIIVHEKMIKKGKPDPEVFLKTISKLNFAPEKCVIIEDSIAGIQAAKKAGTKVVAVTTTLSRNELFDYDLAINNFDELKVEHLKVLTADIN